MMASERLSTLAIVIAFILAFSTSSATVRAQEDDSADAQTSKARMNGESEMTCHAVHAHHEET
jgi:hypothetical protein